MYVLRFIRQVPNVVEVGHADPAAPHVDLPQQRSLGKKTNESFLLHVDQHV